MKLMGSKTQPSVLPPVAQRVDGVLRIEERATFSGAPTDALLTFVHLPLGERPLGRVLMCSSFYEDLQVHYRRDVLVARDLASQGIAVVRFHYRGTGNSAALPLGSPVMSTMVADAMTALAVLAGHSDGPLILYGGRAAALLVSELSPQVDAAGVVLVAPTLTGDDYFRGMSRAAKLARLRDSSQGERASLQDELAERGVADVLGNTVTAASYEDLQPRRVEPAAFRGRQVLLIQRAPTQGLGRAYSTFVQQLASVDSQARTVLLQEREAWFVPDQWEPDEEAPDIQVLRDAVVEWTVDVVRRG